jgi:NAD(P)-dependent dehydrogenase (short-subunit alcohol dehydrogenase family)
MTSFENNKTALVFGISGGIGKSLFENLKQTKEFSNVIGFCRKTKPGFDITNENYMKSLSHSISNQGNIHLLINATGYLSDQNSLPEKKIEDINYTYLMKSLSTNTIGNAFIIKYFVPLMEHKTKAYFITLSARVSSISDNGLGGWYSYRASKAALNQLIKTASIEFKRKNSSLIFLSLHPGTVETKLSKPFLRNQIRFTADEAAKNILNVYKRFDINNSGNLVDYKGDIIPF